ncbi:hypothetical protein Trydic_g14278 [Trypoxylus dichotomus]
MEETFANNLDELIHKIMEIYQRKFRENGELSEAKTEEYMEQTKRYKKRRVNSEQKNRNPYQPVTTMKHWQWTIETFRTYRKERTTEYRKSLKGKNQRRTRERRKPPDRRNKNSLNTRSHRL